MSIVTELSTSMKQEPVRRLRLEPVDDRAAALERHASIQVLVELVDTYGAEAVHRWLRNIEISVGGKGGR